MYQGCSPIHKFNCHCFAWFVCNPGNSGPSGFRNRTIQFCWTRFSRTDYCSVHQLKTRTSGFSRKLNFPRFDRKPDACCPNSFTTVFSSLETCYIVKSSKSAIILKHLSIYAFKDPSRHWKVPTICCTTNNESPNASTCFTPTELRICRPNRMVSYSPWLLVQKYSKWTDFSKNGSSRQN
jgi:hypothetical protein